MLNFKTFLRKKSVLHTVFSAISALFLFMLSFSYSYSVSAAAPSGGFGVGRNQGLETGINTTAFNAVPSRVANRKLNGNSVSPVCMAVNRMFVFAPDDRSVPSNDNGRPRRRKY